MPRIILIISAVVVALLAIEAVRLLQLKASVSGNAKYWNERATRPAEADAFVYVAIGDSVAQGLGASSPDHGYVGLIANDIAARTKRPVRVINLSVTGAKVGDVVRDQLPQLTDLKPDLVTLDIGANDVHRATSTGDFERDYTTILAALPAGKTVVADLPPFGFRDDHGLVMAWNPFVRDQIAAHGFNLAPVYSKLEPRRYDPLILGADFFHPNNYGYKTAWYPAFAPGVDAIIRP